MARYRFETALHLLLPPSLATLFTTPYDMPAFAENLIVDLHDLATILMRERLYTDPRFRHSRLREINDGSKDSLCITVHNVGNTLSEGDDEDEDEVDRRE